MGIYKSVNLVIGIVAACLYFWTLVIIAMIGESGGWIIYLKEALLFNAVNLCLFMYYEIVHYRKKIKSMRKENAKNFFFWVVIQFAWTIPFGLLGSL